jgi:DNA polymerase III alpha subunit
MKKFVHLNVHSSFSFHEGASTIESLVQKALELGMTELALTDTNGMYGAVAFVKACQKKGIKPILGVELAEAVVSGNNSPSPPPRAGG